MVSSDVWGFALTWLPEFGAVHASARLTPARAVTPTLLQDT